MEVSNIFLKISIEYVNDHLFELISSIGIIFSFIYTYTTNHKNKKNDELSALSDVYEETIFLLSYPQKQKETNVVYENEDPKVKSLVNRIIIDSKAEIDVFWSYYGDLTNKIPELKGLTKDEQKKLLNIAQNEYSRFAEENYFSSSFEIVSPAYYSDNEEVYNCILKIKDNLSKNYVYLNKDLRVLLNSVKENDAREVKGKYDRQLVYNDSYFQYNPPPFEDPYHMFLVSILRRYKYLESSFKAKLFDRCFLYKQKIKNVFKR